MKSEKMGGFQQKIPVSSKFMHDKSKILIKLTPCGIGCFFGSSTRFCGKIAIEGGI